MYEPTIQNVLVNKDDTRYLELKAYEICNYRKQMFVYLTISTKTENKIA